MRKEEAERNIVNLDTSSDEERVAGKLISLPVAGHICRKPVFNYLPPIRSVKGGGGGISCQLDWVFGGDGIAHSQSKYGTTNGHIFCPFTCVSRVRYQVQYLVSCYIRYRFLITIIKRIVFSC